MTTSTETSYDRLPYITACFPETHPRRLRTTAMLYGLDAPAIETARVLELGCGTGSNLLPMACLLPNGRFVGIDLSSRQIQTAQEDVLAMGLSNIEFRHMSITDVTPEMGEFDYIICHGVFSWVPKAVQDMILRVSRQNLAPKGVAYVSYNTLPGWHMQTLVRDIMLQGATATDEIQRVRQAREFLKLVSTSPLMPKAVAGWLHEEAENIGRRADSYLAHEYLEEHNEPIYFRQFTEQAGRHGLQYLGDARLNATVLDEPWPAGRQALAPLANDQIRLEQYSDFMRNRMFRRSLLCHAGTALDRAGAAGRVPGFHVAANLRREVPNQINGVVESPDAVRFVTPRGGFIHTTNVAVKAAMTCLMESFPNAVSFETLHLKALAAVTPQHPQAGALRSILGEQFLTYWKLELIELHSAPASVSSAVPAKPAVSHFTRHLASRCTQTVTLRHEMVNLDDICRKFVQYLDGTRTRDELVEQTLAAGMMRGPTGAAADRETVVKAVEQTLAQLAKNGLLLPGT